MAHVRPAHVHRVRVRPTDCDHRGVVHTTRYPVFFEAAMVETLRSLMGSLKELDRTGIDFVLDEMSTRSLAPVRFDDLLRIGVRVRSMGATSLTLAFDADVDGTPVVSGWHRYLAIGMSELRTTQIPDSFRKLLTPARRST